MILNFFLTMKKFVKRSALALLAIPVCILTLILITGLFSEKPYEGKRSAIVAAPVDSVWSLMNNTSRYCALRHEVSRIELLSPDANGNARWTEHTNLAGSMSMEVVKRVQKKYLEIEMTRSSFGLSGVWKFYFLPVPGGTYVLVTERSVADGIIMRGILSLLGRDSNMGLQLKVITAGVAHSS